MSNRHYYEGLMELIGFIFHIAAHGRDELIQISLGLSRVNVSGFDLSRVLEIA